MRVRRFEREDGAPVQEFQVPYRNAMRVLDALNWIAENEAPDLAYRWFCGSKMCGTCAVRMNGREVLACWEAVEPEMTIEPLRNLPVVRDLVVDRAPFERKVASLEPWIERTEPYAGLPRAALAQGHEERLEGARLHRLHVLLFGLPGGRARRPHRLCRSGAARPTRPDRARSAQRSAPRSPVRWRSTGIFNCVSCYKCEEVCPASIPIVTRVIEPLKAKRGRARSRHGPAPACRCDASSRRAAESIPAHSCSACRDLRALRNLPRALAAARPRQDQPCPHLARDQDSRPHAARRRSLAEWADA